MYIKTVKIHFILYEYNYIKYIILQKKHILNWKNYKILIGSCHYKKNYTYINNIIVHFFWNTYQLQTTKEVCHNLIVCICIYWKEVKINVIFLSFASICIEDIFQNIFIRLIYNSLLVVTMKKRSLVPIKNGIDMQHTRMFICYKSIVHYSYIYIVIHVIHMTWQHWSII